MAIFPDLGLEFIALGYRQEEATTGVFPHVADTALPRSSLDLQTLTDSAGSS